MGKRVDYYSFRERFKLNRIIGTVVRSHGSIRGSRAALAEAVGILEDAAENKPSEWVYWYMLGDLYQPLGELVESIKACEKCYELRPNDPRSAYALASNLRTLTQAKHEGDWERIEAMRNLRVQAGLQGYVAPVDIDQSKKALLELGITIDQAAERVMVLFEEVLSIGVRRQDAQHVRENLAAMYTTFPHLEERVRSTRQAPRGLFAEARGDPYNQAVEHYQKLRHVPGERDRMRRELLEIVRLTQAALAKNARHGDALVLLANALRLAALESRFTNDEAYDYFVVRAAAVIQHWLSSRPHTTNKDIGQRVLEGIRTDLSSAKGITPTELERRMEALRNTLLSDALAQDSLTTMQQMLRVD